MSYQEAIKEIVSRRQAQREIKLHGLLWSEFVKDVGDKGEYSGKELLDWLGY